MSGHGEHFVVLVTFADIGCDSALFSMVEMGAARDKAQPQQCILMCTSRILGPCDATIPEQISALMAPKTIWLDKCCCGAWPPVLSVDRR